MQDILKTPHGANHGIAGMPNLPGMHTAWAVEVQAEMFQYMMFIDRSRVPYGADGLRKTQAPCPVPRPALLQGLEESVIFSIPCPSPPSGPHPTHTPEGFP